MAWLLTAQGLRMHRDAGLYVTISGLVCCDAPDNPLSLATMSALALNHAGTDRRWHCMRACCIPSSSMAACSQHGSETIRGWCGLPQVSCETKPRRYLCTRGCEAVN